jgi:hypothetical protein
MIWSVLMASPNFQAFPFTGFLLKPLASPLSPQRLCCNRKKRGRRQSGSKALECGSFDDGKSSLV